MKFMNRFLLAMIVVAPSAFGQPRIEVFTQRPAPLERLPGFELVHYDLSEPERIRQSAPRLPADEKIALAQATAFFASDAGKTYMSAMREAYRGQQKLRQYQLTKLPAIVFEDGRYVIYGSTDLVQSLALYQQYLHDRRE